jgi:anaerobic selenocysteine-containing dehydrogenase
MDKAKPSRRNFLIAAGATGAAAVAAIGAKTVRQPAATSQKDGGKRSGYKLTEHIRNYYRTTLV